LARYVERTKYDWWGTTWRLAILIALALVAIFVVYPWRGLFPTLVMVLLSMWLYIRLVTGRTGYRCANCGKVFQVPTTVNFLTTASMGKNPDGTYYSAKNLTCPHCGKRTKARLLKRADAHMAEGSGRLLK
jgi:DNA-directed RNA polymerase subunit RPC12/RpoP